MGSVRSSPFSSKLSLGASSAYSLSGTVFRHSAIGVRPSGPTCTCHTAWLPFQAGLSAVVFCEVNADPVLNFGLTDVAWLKGCAVFWVEGGGAHVKMRNATLHNAGARKVALSGTQVCAE